jgi:hypothetical protein
MTDKSSFIPEEWKLLLESVMMASLAVTAAGPSGLWGLLKESFAGRYGAGEGEIDSPQKRCAQSLLALGTQ